MNYLTEHLSFYIQAERKTQSTPFQSFWNSTAHHNNALQPWGQGRRCTSPSGLRWTTATCADTGRTGHKRVWEHRHQTLIATQGSSNTHPVPAAMQRRLRPSSPSTQGAQTRLQVIPPGRRQRYTVWNTRRE